jgi:hypothetical protein
MAFNSTKPAAGNRGPATGMPRNVAPTRQAPPDAVSDIRHPSAQSYGENGPQNNASRTNPGEIVESDLARNLRQSSDDGQSVLDSIIKGGTHSVDMGPHRDLAPQTRDLAPGNVPIAHGMRSRSNEGDRVPDRCGVPVSAPVRKP